MYILFFPFGLSDFRVEKVLVSTDQLVHDFIYLFVRQSFLLVQQGETNGVRFLVGTEFFALVNVE